MTDVIFDRLAVQTNLYAQQKQEKNGKEDSMWKDTTKEMKAYI
jgi:hypothetical protein